MRLNEKATSSSLSKPIVFSQQYGSLLTNQEREKDAGKRRKGGSVRSGDVFKLTFVRRHFLYEVASRMYERLVVGPLLNVEGVLVRQAMRIQYSRQLPGWLRCDDMSIGVRFSVVRGARIAWSEI